MWERNRKVYRPGILHVDHQCQLGNAGFMIDSPEAGIIGESISHHNLHTVIFM